MADPLVVQSKAISASETSIQLDNPPSEGNKLVLVVSREKTTTSWPSGNVLNATPSGFTLLRDFGTFTAVSRGVAVYIREVPSGHDGIVSWEWGTGGASTGEGQAVLYEVSGLATADAIAAPGTSFAEGYSTANSGGSTVKNLDLGSATGINKANILILSAIRLAGVPFNVVPTWTEAMEPQTSTDRLAVSFHKTKTGRGSISTEASWTSGNFGYATGIILALEGEDSDVIVEERESEFAVSEAESTLTGSVSYVDKVELNFQPDDNEDWILMWSCVFGGDGISNAVRARIMNDLTNTELGIHIFNPRNTNDRRTFTGFKRMRFGDNPGLQEVSIEFSPAATGQNARIKQATLVAVKMIPSDEYTESEVAQSTTSTTVSNKGVHVHSQAGNKLVLAYTENRNPSSTGSDVRTTLVRSDGVTIVYNGRHGASGEEWSWFAAFKDETIIVGDTTRWQYRSPGSGIQQTMRRARTLVMEATDFPAFAADQNDVLQQTTSTSYSERDNIDPGPFVNDARHLWVAHAAMDLVSEADHPKWRHHDNGDMLTEAETHWRPTGTQPENLPMGSIAVIDGIPDFPEVMDFAASAGTVGIVTSLLAHIQIGGVISTDVFPWVGPGERPWFGVGEDVFLGV